jgi:hypothetical protein
VGNTGSWICQHTDLRLREYLPCKVTEGGGMQCEREEAHGDDIPHWWSKHTMAHERAGNGYACEAFKEPVAMFAVKEMTKDRIRKMNEYLAELDAMPSVP